MLPRNLDEMQSVEDFNVDEEVVVNNNHNPLGALPILALFYQVTVARRPAVSKDIDLVADLDTKADVSKMANEMKGVLPAEAAYTQGACGGMLQIKYPDQSRPALPKVLGNYVGSFLNRKAGGDVALTCTGAATQADNNKNAKLKL